MDVSKIASIDSIMSDVTNYTHILPLCNEHICEEYTMINTKDIDGIKMRSIELINIPESVPKSIVDDILKQTWYLFRGDDDSTVVLTLTQYVRQYYLIVRDVELIDETMVIDVRKTTLTITSLYLSKYVNATISGDLFGDMSVCIRDVAAILDINKITAPGIERKGVLKWRKELGREVLIPELEYRFKLTTIEPTLEGYMETAVNYLNTENKKFHSHAATCEEPMKHSIYSLHLNKGNTL